MSWCDDSDSEYESQTYDKIVELLRVRTQHRCGVRRLYEDVSPAARRSLNVQKIFQKDMGQMTEQSVHKETNNCVAMQYDNEVQKDIPATQTRSQRKSMVCSTPKTSNLKDFVSSLSPVKYSSERPLSETSKGRVLSQCQTKTTSRENSQNFNNLQLKVLLKNVMNSTKNENTVKGQAKQSLVPHLKKVSRSQSTMKDAEQEFLPQKRITRGNLLKPKLAYMAKLNLELQPYSSQSEKTSDKPNYSETLPKPTDAELILSTPPEHIASSSISHSQSIQQISRLQTNQLLSKPNLELPSGFNSQNSRSSNAKQATKHMNSMKKQLLQDWSCAEGIPEIQEGTDEIIPETQKGCGRNECETLVPATQLGSLLSERECSPGTSKSASSSTAIQNISNIKKLSQNPKPQKRSNKKKMSDTYLSYLNLEESIKRKPSKSGSKRKLYSSGQDLNLLLDPSDSNSDSIKRRSQNINKISPEKMHSLTVFDTDGFKVPNAPRTTTSTRKVVNGDPLNTTQLGVIAENIQILNKTGSIIDPKQTAPNKSSSQKSIAKRKQKVSNLSKKRIVGNNSGEQSTEMRRSDRIRHAPMTFWKVHKEPIMDYKKKFYKDMISLMSPKSQSKTSVKTDTKKSESSKVQEVRAPLKKLKSKKINKSKRHLLPKSIDPTLEENCPVSINNIDNVKQTAIIEKESNQTVQITQEESPEHIPPMPFTSIQPTTREQHISDSALQTTTESEDQTNPHEKFLKKFRTVVNTSEQIAESNREISTRSSNVSANFLHIDHLVFQEFSNVAGLEFAFVPNTNEMLGFMKLQPYIHKRESRSSRKYYLTLMLLTDSVITIKINEDTIEMVLGGIDTIQLLPDSRYELTNISAKQAILMLVRNSVRT